MIPKKIVAQVLERDPWCVIQGPNCTGRSEVADHRVGRGAGGSKNLDVVFNLIGACVIDNSWKEDCVGDDRTELEQRGIRIRRSASTTRDLHTALTTPVRYPDGRLLFLTIMGGLDECTEPVF